jgi:deazaflavin-dependent oxidoreductase (nitroreductase family)
MSVPVVPPGRSVAHRIVSRVVLSPLGRRFGRDIASRLDPTLIRLTRGRVSSVWPFPAVVMTHVGAKSGRTRRSALVYFTDRGRVILIATNFGGSRNPAWYRNVRANPLVTMYGRGICGRSWPRRFTTPNATVCFSAPKTPPGLTTSTSRPRPPNPDTFLSLHLRRSAVGATPLRWTLGTEISAERLSQTSETRSLTDQPEGTAFI